MTDAGSSSTHWCCVLAVLVSNLLHSGIAHEVGGLVPPVLQGCAVWGSQRRVCSQVDVLHLHRYGQLCGSVLPLVEDAAYPSADQGLNVISAKRQQLA